jgi:hypothetical protein
MPEIASSADILSELGSIRPLPNASIDHLVNLRARLFEDASANGRLGWRATGGEVNKSNIELGRDQLRWFAGHTFGGIGLEYSLDFLMDPDAVPALGAPFEIPRDRINLYREAVKALLIHETDRIRRWAPELETQWHALMQEPAAIGGLRLQPSGSTFEHPISHHSIRVAFRAPTLLSWNDRTPQRLIEIGGGHGRFIRDCAVMLPNCRFVLTDLPLNMLISARYLAEYFGRDLNLCFLPNHRFKPEARINIVAPWRLEEIDVPVDTACNFLSFQHMDATNLDYYGAALRRMGVDRLFQINRDTTRDAHDLAINDYPFADEFETLREDIANATDIRAAGSAEILARSRQIIRLSKRRARSKLSCS